MNNVLFSTAAFAGSLRAGFLRSLTRLGGGVAILRLLTVPVPSSACPLGFGLMSVAGMFSGLPGIGSGAVKVVAMDLAMGLPFQGLDDDQQLLIAFRDCVDCHRNRFKSLFTSCIPWPLGAQGLSMIVSSARPTIRVSISM